MEPAAQPALRTWNRSCTAPHTTPTVPHNVVRTQGSAPVT